MRPQSPTSDRPIVFAFTFLPPMAWSMVALTATNNKTWLFNLLLSGIMSAAAAYLVMLARKARSQLTEPAAVDIYRYALFSELLAAGARREVADLVTVALYPIDDDFQPGQYLASELETRAMDCAERVRTATPDELEDLALETLETYVELSRIEGEPYYAARYGSVIDEYRLTTDSPLKGSRFGEQRVESDADTSATEANQDSSQTPDTSRTS